jgi:hypothetical protein
MGRTIWKDLKQVKSSFRNAKKLKSEKLKIVIGEKRGVTAQK